MIEIFTSFGSGPCMLENHGVLTVKVDFSKMEEQERSLTARVRRAYKRMLSCTWPRGARATKDSRGDNIRFENRITDPCSCSSE